MDFVEAPVDGAEILGEDVLALNKPLQKQVQDPAQSSICITNLI
jgi:hypothetical protein